MKTLLHGSGYDVQILKSLEFQNKTDLLLLWNTSYISVIWVGLQTIYPAVATNENIKLVKELASSQKNMMGAHGTVWSVFMWKGTF